MILKRKLQGERRWSNTRVVIWLAALLTPGLCFIVWAVATVFFRDVPVSRRLFAGSGLLVVVGIIGFSTYLEIRARRIVERECRKLGLIGITIEERKTHYRVTHTTSGAPEHRKCRIAKGGVVWLDK